MTSTDSINQFFDQIAEGQRSMETLSQKIYIRVLLHSLLDILAQCAFPEVNGNKNRFVMLIDQHSKWDSAKRYSIRQLIYCLSDVKKPSEYPGIDGLQKHAQDLLSHWPARNVLIVSTTIDPTEDDLRSFMTPSLLQLIDRVRYPSLLWATRNFAVHELVHPGYGFDFQLNISAPYYHHFSHEDEHSSWELYFPLELISKIVSECTSSLRAQFLARSLDPWIIFEPEVNWYRGT